MSLQYPIGQFAYEGKADAGQIAAWIEEIERLPVRLREAVSGLDEGQLDTPYREGGWTIRQVVHHLADSHMNSFVRFKLALTEDHPTIRPYYEDRWAELADSVHVPVGVSLTLLEALHERWVVLLRSLDEETCSRTFYHPESKETIQLGYNIGVYAWHGNHHLAHIIALKERMGW